VEAICLLSVITVKFWVLEKIVRIERTVASGYLKKSKRTVRFHERTNKYLTFS
jgi:hypothetical protein